VTRAFWCVEFLHSKGWTPCDSPHWTRKEAREEMRRWQEKACGWKYRVTKFVRASDSIEPSNVTINSNAPTSTPPHIVKDC